MDHLIKMVSERAGISEEQARKAVDTVTDFVKERFPAVSGQIDGFLHGGGAEGGGNALGDVMGRLGGLFGK